MAGSSSLPRLSSAKRPVAASVSACQIRRSVKALPSSRTFAPSSAIATIRSALPSSAAA